MWHIRLIPTNLPPPTYLADFGRSAKYLDFSIFFKIFFLEISVVQLFFRGKVFLDKILDAQNVSKNHEKFFGEQHNIKELSHKKLLSVHTKGTKKFNFFDFSCFAISGFFVKKMRVFPNYFFHFFSFFQKKNSNFFLKFFFSEKKTFFLIFFFILY